MMLTPIWDHLITKSTKNPLVDDTTRFTHKGEFSVQLTINGPIHQISKSFWEKGSIGKIDMENECSCMQLYNITIGGSLVHRTEDHFNDPEHRLDCSDFVELLGENRSAEAKEHMEKPWTTISWGCSLQKYLVCDDVFPKTTNNWLKKRFFPFQRCNFISFYVKNIESIWKWPPTPLNSSW